MANEKRSAMVRAAAILTLMTTAGCQFYARSPEDYKNATRGVLETRSAQVQSCYDSVLKKEPAASGNVVVHFTVKEKTGDIVDVEALPSSTAPPEVGQCVVNALQGLTLDPPDQRKGDATFIWEFTPKRS